MKQFKNFELTTNQINNSIGKGKPAFAGKPDFENTGSYDADGEWIAPWEGLEGGRKAYGDAQVDPTV